MNEELIKQLIGELQESKQRDRDVINTMQNNIASMNKLLKGNGNIGLCETVRNLDAKISAEINQIKSRINPLWILVSAIGLTLLTSMVKDLFVK